MCWFPVSRCRLPDKHLKCYCNILGVFSLLYDQSTMCWFPVSRCRLPDKDSNSGWSSDCPSAVGYSRPGEVQWF